MKGWMIPSQHTHLHGRKGMEEKHRERERERKEACWGAGGSRGKCCTEHSDVATHCYYKYCIIIWCSGNANCIVQGCLLYRHDYSLVPWPPPLIIVDGLGMRLRHDTVKHDVSSWMTDRDHVIITWLSKGGGYGVVDTVGVGIRCWALKHLIMSGICMKGKCIEAG